MSKSPPPPLCWSKSGRPVYPSAPSRLCVLRPERGRRTRQRREERKKQKGRELLLGLIHGRTNVRSLARRRWGRGGNKAPLLSRSLPPSVRPSHPHPHRRTRSRAPARRGYVAGLSGLLTGLPPFMTAGSLVLLLGGTAALGTVSPTSCNDGSLYMATGEGVGEGGQTATTQSSRTKKGGVVLVRTSCQFTCAALKKAFTHRFSTSSRKTGI